MKRTGQIVELDTEDYNRILSQAGVDLGPDPGSLVGKGEGARVYLDEKGKPVLVDFGQCGFCGIGHYVADPGSLWGVCNYCGAT